MPGHTPVVAVADFSDDGCLCFDDGRGSPSVGPDAISGGGVSRSYGSALALAATARSMMSANNLSIFRI